jgi:hyperosmotically inducible periplasmic protein
MKDTVTTLLLVGAMSVTTAAFAATTAQNSLLNPADTTVSSPMSDSDTALVTNVQNKISQNEVLKQYNFVIESREGVITLNGTVDTQNQADAAVDAAKSVDGVKDVKSNIIVKSPNSTSI